MITDDFDKSNGILMVVLSGEITMDEMIGWIDSLTPDRIPVRKLKLCDDASDASYMFKVDEIKHVDQAINNLCSRFNTVQVAIVHRHPKETAYSNLIIKTITATNYQQRIFSDMFNAIHWLK